MGDFFTGALPTDSGTQWPPNITIDTNDRETNSTFQLHWEWKGAHITLIQSAGPWNQETLKRLACHLLLEGLPDERLEDVVDAFNDIYEFQVLQSSGKTALPEPQKIPGMIGKSYERPDYYVIEE